MSSKWEDQLREAKRQLEKERIRQPERAKLKQEIDNLIKAPLIARSVAKVSSQQMAGTVSSNPVPKTIGPTVANRTLPPAPAWQRIGRRFNIGVDFGTSSTKICAREHKGVVPNAPESVLVLHLENSPTYLCPSTILIKGDRLYFGHQAEREETMQARPLRHLKSCLACEIEKAGSAALPECQSMRQPGTDRCAGLFEFAQPLSASQLVTLYLGWVMREARVLVAAAQKLGAMTAFTYHVGLPLAHLDQAVESVSQYKRILYQAWRISDGLVQGLEVSQAFRWLKEVTNESVPSDEDSPIQVDPEIVAALVPFLNGSVTSGRLTPGLYGLVDIGAWTIDIAMFRYSDNSVASFPVTSVRRNGCNLIDEKLRAGLLELIAHQGSSSLHLLSAVRDARETHTFDETSFRVARYQLTPPPSLQDYCLRVASAKLWRQFLETVKEAHAKWIERYEEDTFSNFKVFLLGGGSNITQLSEAPNYFKTPVTQSISSLSGLRADFKVIRNKTSTATGLPVADYRRLAIAHGLAFPAGTWPEVTKPSQVVPALPLRTREHQTHEELGYDEK